MSDDEKQAAKAAKTNDNDTEQNIDDREYEEINKHWKHVKWFLQAIKDTNQNMSIKSKEQIKKIKEELKTFTCQEIGFEEHEIKTEDTTDRKEESTGAKPKVRKTGVNLNMKEESTMTDTASDTSDQVLHRNVRNKRRIRINQKKILENGRKAKNERLDSTCTTSSSSSNSSNYYRNMRRKITKHRNTRKHKEENDITVLTSFLKRLDARAVPDIEKYNESSGVHLSKYLDKFEDYCQTKFRGKDYLWTHELEKHLAGRTLDGFKAIRKFDDDYREVKEKLLGWYSEEEENRKRKAKQRFNNAKPRTNETMYLYSQRLEGLYLNVHPKHQVKYSKTLINKYKDTVHTDLKIILNSQLFDHKLKGEKVLWKTIQKCGRIYDLDVKQDSGKDSDNDKEIIINLNKPTNTNTTYKPHTDNQQRYYQSKQFFNNRFRNTDKNTYQGKFTNNKQFLSQRRPIEQGKKCNLCKRFGHNEADCRTKHNKCFICGRNNHFYRDCYYNKNNQSNSRVNKNRTKSVSPKKFDNRVNNRSKSQVGLDREAVSKQYHNTKNNGRTNNNNNEESLN